MNQASVAHATFVIDRSYDAPPARAFAAWASPQAKCQWFAGPEEWERLEHELDFRVGGRERTGGRQPNGSLHVFEAVYCDIVEHKRIVTTYEMYENHVRTSVSLATVEFAPEALGTRLTYTEQGAYLDGRDTPTAREAGTRRLLEALDAVLRQTVGSAT